MIGWKHVITLCPECVDRFFGFVLFDKLFDFLALSSVDDSKISPGCPPPQRDGQLRQRTDTTT
jgi:hypothetical protein